MPRTTPLNGPAFAAALFGSIALIGACTGDSGSPGSDAGTDAPADGSGSDAAADAPADGSGVDVGPDAPDDGLCDDGLEAVAFTPGDGAVHRRELASDFTVPLADGSTLTLSEAWSGCDSWIFLPDTIPVSQADQASFWRGDLDALVARSPDNVHYVFVSRATSSVAGRTAIAGMQDQVDALLDGMEPGDADYWVRRLHVVDKRAPELEGWLRDVLVGGIGQAGFAIDRFQQIRGVGSFADVTRFDVGLQAAGGWPWEANLAYAAHEARYFNMEAARAARLAAQNATVVPLWQGEVISQFADTTVTLPSAEELARYDTLEIEVLQMCPDPNTPEFGNCGAWDYLAHLWIYDPEGNRVEMGRYITTYHREAHMIVDATPALAWLAAGGEYQFRWEWAPEWNVQPTATRLNLRFYDRGTGLRPTEVVPLFEGGAFNSAYNAERRAIDVPIPANAARVEVRAIITGHGAETSQCAEFCNHQHEIGVNGEWFTREHPQVGNQEGCIAEIENGMTPNQWGTWWFGRGGWCPGQQVEPWIIDVTDIVEPGGTARVQYNGLLEGRDPPDGAGNILMKSWLAVYAE
jgi:hypothetical protein